MKSSQLLRVIILPAVFMLLPLGAAWAQASPAEHRPSAASTGNSSQTSSAQALTHESNQAAGRTESAEQEKGAKHEAEEDRTAQFKRSRPDRTPESCTYEQLERPVRFNVDEVLAG